MTSTGSETATSTEPRFALLGLSAGNPGGSAEILLTEALSAAQAGTASIELVRLADLDLSPTAGPRDADWLWERLVSCDGLIVSSPIISRTISASLKSMIDRLLGPSADAAFVERMLELRRGGADLKLPFRLDERVLKPRVAGLIAVGGSLTGQWKALALPVMHSVAFSMHMAVVDQMVVGGAGTPRSVLLMPESMARAQRLGRNVAEQLGVAFDHAEYRGDPGVCPMCHLSVIELDGTNVACATCGARGVLERAAIRWTDLDTSVISMAEKRDHVREVEDTARHHAARGDEIAAAMAERRPIEPSRS